MITQITKPFLFIVLFIILPFAGFCQLPVPQWVNDIGGAGDSKPTGLITDNQNNIYITGYFSNTVDFDPSAGVKNLTSVGGYDIYVAKYKPDGSLVWAVSMGGNGLDQVNNMTVDANGNPTIVGQFQSNVLTAGAFNLTGQGAEDMFLIHLDTNGNIIWATSFGASGTDRGEQVSADAQGNVTTTSIFQYTVTVGGTSYTAGGSQYNGLMVKYDINGNVLWAINLGTSGDTEVYGNGTDSNGNIVVSGYYDGSVDFDPLGAHTTLNAGGAAKGFVAKYSPAGKLIWVNSIDGTYVNNGSIISIDSNNDIYLAATVNFQVKFGGTTLTPVGVQDVFIAKYSSAGTFQFVKDIGGNGFSGGAFAYQLRNDPNNNDIYITGYFNGTIDFDPSAAVANVSDHGQRDFFIGRYDSNGNYKWAFGGGSANCNLSLGIELGVDNNSNVIAGGSFCSTVNFDPSNCTSTPVTAINFQSDTYIAKYTPTSSPVITNNVLTAPSPAIFCGNTDPAPLTASTPTGGSGIYTYQWQNSADGTTFADIGGATNLTYDPPALNTTIYYRRIVSSPCAVPNTSNVISIQIQPPLANNTVTAPAIVSFCANGDPSVITGAAATGGNGTYAYQWQSSTDGTTFTDIAGATSLSYDPAVISATTYYRRTVTSGACTAPAASNIVQFTVQPALANNTLDAQPINTFCGQYAGPAGGVGTYDLTGSTPSGGNGTYAYQWQSSTDNVTFTNIAGATSSDLVLPKTTITTWYRRLVTSGNCALPLPSNALKITIEPVLANDNITAPAVIAFCGAGNPAVITGSLATGGNGTPVYQWQSSTDNVTFTDIPAATSKDYDPPVLNTTTYYRRTVTSGSCTTPLISGVVTIQVTTSPATPVLTAATVDICAGNTATLSVSSPQAGITYDWYDSPAKTTHLLTGSTYTTVVLNSSQSFYVEATNSALCTSPALASVQVNVTGPPVPPAVASNSVAVCDGSSAMLSISGPQSGLTYNWYSAPTGGSVVFTGTDFITPAILSNTIYYAEAANSGGCVSASRTPVTITVNPLPQVTVQGTSVCPGIAATLIASSTDNNAVIKWYSNATGGSPVFIGASFTTPALNSNTTYYAEAFDNLTGCISTTRTMVQVQILQPLTTPEVVVSATTTSSVTFQWAAVNGATAYQVSRDNGQTFTDPSSGSDGLTHTVSGLQAQQTVSIIVTAIGNSPCQQSANSVAVTGTAASQLGDQIFVPNAFTPNADGKNDVLYVRGPNIRSVKFYVYDQWGELIYSSLNPDSGWDGTYKGSKEPVGVYVYYVEATMNDGQLVKKKGSVTLLR